jgi:tRNA-dihydrouridine synthase
VDAVMIGRAAVKDPLIFSRYAAGEGETSLSAGRVLPQFLELLEELYDPPMRVVKFRPFIRYFFSRQRNAKIIRSRLYAVQDYRKLKEYLSGYGDFDIPGKT